MAIDDKTAQLHSTPVEEVIKAHQMGSITDEDARDYHVFHRIQRGEWLGLDPEDAALAHQRGYINDQQGDDYFENYQSPIWFKVKDIAKSVPQGIRNAGQELINTVDHVGNWLMNSEGDEYHSMGTLPQVYHPKTGWGEFAQDASQFTTGFIPFMKAAKGISMIPKAASGIASGLSKLPKMAAMAEQAPNVAAFLEATLAGAATDVTMIDPYKPRLSNLLVDWKEGFEPIFGFLKADPADPTWLAKLRAAAEGAFTGLAVEGILMGARILKANLFAKHHGDPAGVAQDVNQVMDEVASEVPPKLTENGLVVRAEGVGGRAAEGVNNTKSLTKPDHVYRGMTEEEFVNTVGDSGEIVSKNQHSLPGEGTNFADRFDDAESYINYGRDDPRTTGKPTYIVEVEQRPNLVKNRQGYYEAHSPVPSDQITRVWKMTGEGDEIIAREISPSVEKAASSETVAEAAPKPTKVLPPIQEELNRDPAYNTLMDILEDDILMDPGSKIPMSAMGIADHLQVPIKDVREALLFAQDHGLEVGHLKDLRKYTWEDAQTQIEKAKAEWRAQRGETTAETQAAGQGKLPDQLQGESQASGEILQGQEEAQVAQAQVPPNQPVNPTSPTAPGVGTPPITPTQITPTQITPTPPPPGTITPVASPTTVPVTPKVPKNPKRVRIALPEHTKVNEFMSNEIPDLAKKIHDEAMGVVPKPPVGPKEVLGSNFVKYDDPEQAFPMVKELMVLVESSAESLPETEAKAITMLSEVVGSGRDAAFLAQQFAAAGEKIKVLARAVTMYRQAQANQIQIALKRVDRTNPADMLRLGEMLENQTNILAAFRSGESDIGRAMRNMQHDATSIDNMSPQMLNDLWEKTGNRVTVLVDEYSKLKTLKERNHFLRNMKGNKWTEFILAMKQSAVLWGWATTARNLVGQGALFAKNFGIDEFLGVGAEKFSNSEFEAVKYMSSLMYGLQQGMAEAIHTVPKALMTGENQTDAVVRSLPGLAGKYGKRSAINEVLGDTIGNVLTANFRVLTATDEAFQTVGYHIAKNQLIFENAFYKHGFRGEALDAWIEMARANLPPDIHMGAIVRSREGVFKETLTGWQRTVVDAIDGAKGGAISQFAGPLIKAMFMPFPRITFALNNVALRNSPLGILSQKVRNDLMAGGIVQKRAMSRMITGTALMYTGYQLAQSGLLTGRIPKDEAATAESSGIQSYSYHNGKEWVSLQGLDPMVLPFIVGADLNLLHRKYDWEMMKDTPADRDMQSLVYGSIAAMTEAVTRQSFMQGAYAGMQMLFDPEKAGIGKFIPREAGSYVPFSGALKDINKAFNRDDADERDLGDIFKNHEAMVNAFWTQYVDPGKLPLRRNPLYGTPIERENRTWYGGKVTTETQDPALVYMAEHGIDIDRMSDKIPASTGEFITLTPEQLDKAQSLVSTIKAGKYTGLQEALGAAVAGLEKRNVQDPTIQKKVIQGIISDFRAGAKQLVLKDSPELRAEIERNIQKRHDFRLGVRVNNNPTTLLRNLRDYYNE